jgi:hypothetical protein
MRQFWSAERHAGPDGVHRGDVDACPSAPDTGFAGRDELDRGTLRAQQHDPMIAGIGRFADAWRAEPTDQRG